jgi:hypothetical protein
MKNLLLTISITIVLLFFSENYFAQSRDSARYSVPAPENETAVIFPNPFNHYLNIVFNERSIKGKVDFKLIDVTGKEVLSEEIVKVKTNFEINNLPEGVYLYKVLENGAEIQNGRVILKY